MCIRVGIYGYGNLGRGVECAIRQNSDMELVAVVTRRAPETLKTITGVKAVAMSDIASQIISSWKFDQQCKQNAKNRDEKKNYTKKGNE